MHIASTSTSIANQQTEHSGPSARTSENVPIFIMGDFNRGHTEPVVLGWRASWTETDSTNSSTYNRDDVLDRKYDYVFGMKLRTARRYSITRGCDTESDHCWLYGAYRIP
jgi:endonuclease/exonuclease/phosphatase family metal-dependent hydrolase